MIQLAYGKYLRKKKILLRKILYSVKYTEKILQNYSIIGIPQCSSESEALQLN